ncbi:MAG: sulfite exporter TauE/SafE [Parasphingorhabdus sp.]|jgi:sulfite exporter TauE/SafE
MVSAYIPVTAFMLGFFGSVHCVAMCGGISGYLQQGASLSSSIGLSLALAAGRLMSYAVAGVIAASMGTGLVHLFGQHLSHEIMQIFIGTFLILLGIGLAGWWSGLSWIERFGGQFWKYLAPLAGRLLPATTYPRAFAAGALWGWLPCGLVYSALVLVIGSGDLLIGGVSMIAFGLGTIPILAFVGVTSRNVNFKNKPIVRQFAGTAVALFGVLVFTGLITPSMVH